MQKKIINGFKAISFLLVLAILVIGTQKVLVNKFKYPTDYEDHLGRYKEFEQLDKDTIDVISVGTSHAMYGLSPMEIYKNYGISVYNLAGSAQRIDISYLLLEKAFHSQSPQVVMLDVSSLFIDTFDNAPWRKTVDNISLDKDKLKFAQAYATAYTGLSVSEEKTLTGKISALSKKLKAAGSMLFPLYYYHNRWKELTQYDVSSLNEMTYTKGYYMTTWVTGANATIEHMNEVAEEAINISKYTKSKNEEGQVVSYNEPISLYSKAISEKNLSWLMQIKELCEKNNAQLILYKIPSVSNPMHYAPSWTKMRSDVVKNLAEELELEFIDLLYDADTHMNMSVSFSDAGGHLNYIGAKAISDYVGRYLAGLHKDYRTNAYYDQGLKFYRNIAFVADLQTETSFDKYLGMLRDNWGKLSVLMSVNADASWLSDEQYDVLKEMGVLIDVRKAGLSYICVLDQGKNIAEMQSESKITSDKLELDMGVVEITSGGNTLAALSSSGAAIKINNKDYAENTRGLNIVVVDKESGLVVDSVGFYANGDGSVGWKRSNSNNLLKDYEHCQYELEKNNLPE